MVGGGRILYHLEQFDCSHCVAMDGLCPLPDHLKSLK